MRIWQRILYFFCATCRPHQSRTVRYAFPVVLGAVALLSALTISSNSQTFIEIVPSKSAVREGEAIALEVFVTAETPVNAVDIAIKVPQTQLKVSGIDTGESVITLWTVDPYYENGTAYLRGGTFRRGFVGRHLIATINATAVASGLAQVNVRESMLLAGDGSGTEVDTTTSEAETVKLYIANEDGTFTAADGTTSSIFEASAEIKIITDIDGDGEVTLADISRFMSAWFTHTTIFDFSGDGKMTFKDFSIILADTFLK